MDDATVERAVEAARAAMQRAYAPYSGFPVGAALVAGGTIFTGENIENASYPVSVCAERNAVGRMIDAGEHRIELVAVVTGAERPTPPCGACRQVLWEFCGDLEVVLVNPRGASETLRLKDLFPRPFDASFL